MSQPRSSTPQSWEPGQARPPTEPNGSAPTAARSKQPLWLGVGGLVVVILASGAIGFFLGRDSASPSSSELAASQVRLQSAYDKCRRHDADDTLTITDGGATIVVETRSEYGSTAGMDCVLDALGTSESINAQMGRTTAMMGVQDAESEGIEYSWSYHPDNGVDMVITDTGIPGTN